MTRPGECQTAPALEALKPPTLLRGLPPAERGALRTGGMEFNTPVFHLFPTYCESSSSVRCISSTTVSIATSQSRPGQLCAKLTVQL